MRKSVSLVTHKSGEITGDPIHVPSSFKQICRASFWPQNRFLSRPLPIPELFTNLESAVLLTQPCIVVRVVMLCPERGHRPSAVAQAPIQESINFDVLLKAAYWMDTETCTFQMAATS